MTCRNCSCPACKPTDDESPPTPKGDDWEPCKLCGCPEGRCPGAEVSCHGNPCFHVRDGGRTPESVSEAEHQASELGASRADSAAPVVHVVRLHEDTVRALVAGLHRQHCTQEDAIEVTEALLAKLEETKPCL